MLFHQLKYYSIMMKCCCLIVTIFCAIRVSHCGRLTRNCLTSNGKCARKGVACDDAFGEGWIDKGKCCNERPCCIYKCPNLCRSANYSCGFEDHSCVFQFDTLGDYVWSYKTGSTTTAGTGPLEAAEGTHYLYTDANNGENGTTAILTTAATNLPACPYCLSFKYHMMGPHVGTLEFLAGEKGSTLRRVWKYIGGLSFSHDDWRNDTENIPQYCNPVFTIISTRGDGTIGDIAIDDILLRTGACDAGE
ncbi:MAM domain-containing glycosylphosphatidylinositol anchor protein 1-like isoform X2 [Mytilus edulis]|uniref:MAM domain-containing glycosylphosphatidylinositol anchor protein 1-like isoform X2 n=2 Tax=Mytilus edulis TaxID=6550 RepID=UPI0039F1281F